MLWWMRSCVDAWLDWLYPRRCVGCGRFHKQVLCEACALQVPRIVPPACRRCGAAQTEEGCLYCRGRAYAFDEAVCACAYEPPVRFAITRLKFRRWLRAGDWLGTLVAEALRHPHRRPLQQADCIVPMPLHPRRFAQRGFNQAFIIAQAVGRTLQIPVETHAVRRRFYRHPQVGLDAAARWRNMRDAFEPLPSANLAGKLVLLIDDVFTTGSTFDACARALKQAGARYVVAVAVAREMMSLSQENTI